MRATSVVRFLTKEHGVDAKKVVASGRGEFFPVLEGKTTDVRSKNRRIEVVLIPELDKLYQLIQN
jgi:chemotaxis protein MotB